MEECEGVRTVYTFQSFSCSFQEVFVRSANASKDIKASTHLICPTPEGSKHRASVKWNVPAVTSDWLIQCAKTGKREPEDSFKVQTDNVQVLPYDAERTRRYRKEVIKWLLGKLA